MITTTTRVRPSPASKNSAVSRMVYPGIPSHSNVRTIRSFGMISR